MTLSQDNNAHNQNSATATQEMEPAAPSTDLSTEATSPALDAETQALEAMEESHSATGEDFASPYDDERELELRTLSDPRLRDFLRAQNVRLIDFSDVFAAAHAS